MRLAYTMTAVALALAEPAFADVTIHQAMSGKALGFSKGTTGTTWIKGNRMRTDAVIGKRTHTTIYDLDAQKLYLFDSRKKQADVWEMATFAAEIQDTVDMSGARGTFAPNGQTRQIGGHVAEGYDVEIVTRAGMDAGSDLTVTLAGVVWIVEGAPGTEDYARFYNRAVDDGWIFSDPRAAKAQPGQAVALAEMYRQIANVGGLPYEVDVEVKLSGTGPMAAMFARMGDTTMSSAVETVETGAVPDELFSVPADYKLKPKD